MTLYVYTRRSAFISAPEHFYLYVSCRHHLHYSYMRLEYACRLGAVAAERWSDSSPAVDSGVLTRTDAFQARNLLDGSWIMDQIIAHSPRVQSSLTAHPRTVCWVGLSWVGVGGAFALH